MEGYEIRLPRFTPFSNHIDIGSFIDPLQSALAVPRGFYGEKGGVVGGIIKITKKFYIGISAVRFYREIQFEKQMYRDWQKVGPRLCGLVPWHQREPVAVGGIHAT